MDITIVGIDLAKNIFHVHGVNSEGNTVLQKKEHFLPSSVSCCKLGNR